MVQVGLEHGQRHTAVSQRVAIVLVLRLNLREHRRSQVDRCFSRGKVGRRPAQDGMREHLRYPFMAARRDAVAR